MLRFRLWLEAVDNPQIDDWFRNLILHPKDTPRYLIFADWLEEQGENVFSPLIRLSLEYESADPGRRRSISGTINKLVTRNAGYFADLEGGWVDVPNQHQNKTSIVTHIKRTDNAGHWLPSHVYHYSHDSDEFHYNGQGAGNKSGKSSQGIIPPKVLGYMIFFWFLRHHPKVALAIGFDSQGRDRKNRSILQLGGLGGYGTLKAMAESEK